MKWRFKSWPEGKQVYLFIAITRRTFYFLLSLNPDGNPGSKTSLPLCLSSGHFATITLTFNDKNGETEVCMEGRGIPAPEEERTRQGWQRYYFEGIKQTFGYGARLF